MSVSGLTVAKVEAALRKYHGIVTQAAEACGVARPTLYNFMKKHPELKEIRDDLDETLLDVAESNVIGALQSNDMKTTRWYLERKGKDRGYVTRQEQTGRDGAPLLVSAIKREIVKPAKVAE